METTEKKNFCMNCGAEMEEGQPFCMNCGHPANGAAAPAAAPVKKTAKKSPLIAIIAVVLVVLVVVLVIALGGKKAKSIELEEDDVVLKIGETVKLKYEILPEDTKNKEVTWTSSDEKVATVKNGKVTAKGEGDCEITVETKNGKTDVCDVEVLPAGPDLQAIYDEHCSYEYAHIASDGSYLSIDTNPDDDEDYIDFEAYYALQAVVEALELPESVMNNMEQTRAIDGMQSYSTDELYITWSYHPDNGLEVNFNLVD